jgi:arylsulfatase A-like enzyme
MHSVPLGGLQPGDIQDTVPVYKAMIQALDTEIGRLLDALGPSGTPERDNTVIVVMGDNGTPAAVKDTGTGVRGSKSSIYEGGVRVPLIVTGAGVTRIGEREEALVNGADLYATFADLSGIPVSQIEDAWSITPLFTDGSASTGRDYAFTEVAFGATCGYTIRNLQYKLIFTGGAWAIYDLINDPLESDNLYDDPSVAEVRAELEAELAIIEANGPQGCF